ncbi:MAG: SIR2 family NAD-dependent protein deacylase [Chloroflexota bacterium]
MSMMNLPQNVAVLTGAGVSAESGIPTFRGEAGLWRNFRPEELATPAAFFRDPALVWQWYEWRRGIIGNCQANAAHHTLARMERAMPHLTLITQNVDGLHQLAGSARVLELHGNIWRARCTREGTVTELLEHPLAEIPPRCACGAMLRPDVVWFGEGLPPDTLQAAFAAVQSCQVMLVVGTSGVVEPAASLPRLAKQRGAHVIEINLAATPISRYADEVRLGPAAVELPRLWAQWQVSA